MASEKRIDEVQVQRAIGMLLDPEHMVEISQLHPVISRIVAARDTGGIMSAVRQLGGGTGCYLTMNPLVRKIKGARASDADVLRYRWLFLDFDRADTASKKSGCATEPERQSARAVAQRVRDYLTEEHAWPAPVEIDSGNGYYLLYRIDLANDDAGALLMERTNHAIGNAFSTPSIALDPGVHNPSRLMRMPGTWNQKGEDNPDRPHRLCKIISAPETVEIVDCERLEALVADLAVVEQANKEAEHRDSVWTLTAQVKTGASTIDRARAYLAHCPPAVSGAKGHSQTMAVARSLVYGFNLTAETALSLMMEQWNHACSPPWSEKELRHKVEQADKVPYRKPRGYLLDVGQQESASPYKSVTVTASPTPRKGATEQATAEVRADIWTLPQLLSADLPPTRWAIPGLLGEGLNILAGKPKLGKSFLALNLGITIACGGMALGTLQTEPGNVLYLSLEDRWRRLQDRSRKIVDGLGLGASDLLQFAIEWPRQNLGGTDLLIRWLETVPNPRMVIVDVWQKFRTADKGRGNAYAADYDAATELKSIMDARGCSCLVLHHCKKAAAEDVVDEISGTLGLAGAADGLMVLSRARDENEAVINITGRDVEQSQKAIRFNPDTCSWTDLGDAEAHQEMNLAQRILVLLEESADPLYPKEIAEALKQDNGTVRSRISRMIRDGLIKKNGNRYEAIRDGGEIPI